MTRKRTVWGGVAGAVLLLGLVIGFWPQTINTPGLTTTGVECGSPFATDSSPGGTSTAQSWADALGYQNNGLLDESPAQLARYCEIYLESERTMALVVTGIGVLGLSLLALDVHSGRRRAAADLDAQWRAQGWRPAREIQAPPPGWRRVEPHDAGDDDARYYPNH